MNIRIVGVACTLATCLAAIVWGQSAAPSQKNATRNLVGDPRVPAWKVKALNDKGYRLDQAAAAALKAGDYATAEAEARESMSTTIGVNCQITLAAALDAQGKTQEALKVYKVLNDEGDEDPFDELPYARLLLETGHWAEAVKAYNKQLPNLSNGDLMQARNVFSPDVSRPTDLATAIHIGLGLTTGWRGYHGTYQDVLKQQQGQFQQAQKLEPDSSLANYYVGYGLNRLGRHAEAQAAFKKAAALDNGDVKAAALKELPETMKPR